MKSVALIGPPLSGKTTVFRALCPNADGKVGIVEIQSSRLDRLSKLVLAQKITSARFQVHDSDKAPLAQAREADALAIVVSSWDGSDHMASLESFRTDCVLADLATIEKSLTRTAKKSSVKPDETQLAEIDAYERANELLSDGKWLSESKLDSAQRLNLHLLGLVTIKDAVTIVNEAEDVSDDASDDKQIRVKASLEAEVAQLPEADAKELLEGFGVAASARETVVSGLVDLLDLIFFFTGNEVEARQWEIIRGTKAPKAAGTVHGDFEKGFIRWEAVDFEDFMELGSWDAARSVGKLRVEGKDYVVKDGDVVRILHS